MSNLVEQTNPDAALTNSPQPDQGVTPPEVPSSSDSGGQVKKPADKPGPEKISGFQSTGRSPFGRMNNLLTMTAALTGLLLLVLVILQAVPSTHAGKDYAKILNLLMVGAAGFGLGTFAGF